MLTNVTKQRNTTNITTSESRWKLHFTNNKTNLIHPKLLTSLFLWPSHHCWTTNKSFRRLTSSSNQKKITKTNAQKKTINTNGISFAHVKKKKQNPIQKFPFYMEPNFSKKTLEFGIFVNQFRWWPFMSLNW
jgi:hypothetical protein